MKILGFSTSTDVISVCVIENQKLLCGLNANVGKKHSTMLLPVIDNILSLLELDISQIDFFACDIGPGSFTGIRIGVSTANAFAISTGRKIVGVPSLDILANNAAWHTGYIVSLLYARNDQIYGGLYKDSKQIGDFFAGSIDVYLDILEKYKGEKIIFAGDGGIVFKDKIIDKLSNRVLFSCEQDNVMSALSLSRLAFLHKDKSDEIFPLYLKQTAVNSNAY